MRKSMAALLALLMLMPFVACNSNDHGASGGEVLDKSCREIIEYIYEHVEQTQYIKDHMTYTMFHDTEAVASRCSWFLGIDGIPFQDACASESAMSPADYSLVVVKIKNGENAEAWMKSIDDNIDHDKWICMGAGAKRIERIGDVILLALADRTNADNIARVFLGLK
ncbi:MAG: hypothetical protein FWH51_02920 [Dehalococcoidia bacterium]|nr:hypothetical protein [Dehalococcoidia bacterium]